MNGTISRRRFLVTSTALASALAAGRIVRLPGVRAASPPAAPPAAGPPERQHAWNDFLHRDTAGNPEAPKFHRLLHFNLAGPPTPEGARRLEAVFTALERRFPWGPDGLLFVVAWGPRYFEERLGVESPVPRPEALSSFETPEFDHYDVCIHLASDHEDRLAQVEAALVQGARLPGVPVSLSLAGILDWQETRTGFTGPGIPAARQGVSGIPPGKPVPPDSPLFMGFKSGFARNQATEDDITIPEGPLAGGTTMHVSRIRLRLDAWYRLLDEQGRVARMFSPRLTPEQVRELKDEAPTFAESLEEDAARYGVVGHLQAAGRARRNGRPIILRRDFNTVDGGVAGVHFVGLQRSIADFVATRQAMNAEEAPYLNPAIDPRSNNGIKEFMFVLRRANYVVPPRSRRSFPLLEA